MELEKFEEVYQVLEAQKEKEKCKSGKISQKDCRRTVCRCKRVCLQVCNDAVSVQRNEQRRESRERQLPHQSAQPVHGQCPHLFPLSTEQRGECAGHQQAGSRSKDFR